MNFLTYKSIASKSSQFNVCTSGIFNLFTEIIYSTFVQHS